MCRAALAVWAIEVAGVLAGRTLELSFASAIASTATDMTGADTALKVGIKVYVMLSSLLTSASVVASLPASSKGA